METRHYIQKEADEICHKCGYINKNGDDDLEWDGAPISGTYTICPNCKEGWRYKETNIRKTKMVSITMTEDEYKEMLIKNEK